MEQNTFEKLLTVLLYCTISPTQNGSSSLAIKLPSSEPIFSAGTLLASSAEGPRPEIGAGSLLNVANQIQRINPVQASLFYAPDSTDTLGSSSSFLKYKLSLILDSRACSVISSLSFTALHPKIHTT